MSDTESIAKDIKFKKDQLDKLKEESTEYADRLERAGQLLGEGKLDSGTFPRDVIIVSGGGKLAPYPSMKELAGFLSDRRSLEEAIARLEKEIPEHMKGL